jgi:hypothetical protein
MPVKYSFITKWKTAAPIQDVWDAIRLSLEWPAWWKDFISVQELEPGDELGVGSIRRYTLKSPTTYRLTFDILLNERIEHKRLSGKASGELEGSGDWYFEVKDGSTFIECHWHVHTTKPWMNAFAFILRPAFQYNHKLSMKRGARYLSEKLGVPVTDIS